MFDLNECKIQMLETVQAHESELKNIRTIQNWKYNYGDRSIFS